MKEYVVYMLRCRDKSYYVGVTNNLELRLCEHNEGIDSKCYTYSKRPLQLVWNYSFDDIRDAIAVEKQIKGWSRKKKEALIEGNFDLISELAECKNETHFTISKNRRFYRHVTLSVVEG